MSDEHGVFIASGTVRVDPDSLRRAAFAIEVIRRIVAVAVHHLNVAANIEPSIPTASTLAASTQLDAVASNAHHRNIAARLSELDNALACAATIYDRSENTAFEGIPRLFTASAKDPMELAVALGLVVGHDLWPIMTPGRSNPISSRAFVSRSLVTLAPYTTRLFATLRMGETAVMSIGTGITALTQPGNDPWVKRIVNGANAASGYFTRDMEAHRQLLAHADTDVERSSAYISWFTGTQTLTMTSLSAIALRGATRPDIARTFPRELATMKARIEGSTMVVPVPGETRPNEVCSRQTGRCSDLIPPRHETATPHSVADTLSSIDALRSQALDPAALDLGDTAPDEAEFEILRHETPDRDRPSWTVVLRGTRDLGVGSSTNPNDMLSNFELVGGLRDDHHDAIVAALEMSGAGKGDAVEFVGHSQGGLVAASLAASPDIRARYSVASVVTAGSPIGGIPVPDHTPVMSFEHVDDAIAGLDGQINRSSPNHVTVHAWRNTTNPHDLAGYISDAHAASAQNQADFDAWEMRRKNLLGLNPQTHTTSQRWTLRRVIDPTVSVTPPAGGRDTTVAWGHSPLFRSSSVLTAEIQ